MFLQAPFAPHPLVSCAHCWFGALGSVNVEKAETFQGAPVDGTHRRLLVSYHSPLHEVVEFKMFLLWNSDFYLSVLGQETEKIQRFCRG